MDNRELDKAIAEKFFNLSIEHDFYPPGDEVQFCRRCSAEYGDTGPCARRYSSDPLACSLVLDEIERRGWSWKWVHNSDWFHSFDFFLHDGTSEFMADSDNRYRAVCEAVMGAIEESEK
jgi:hypothetical protein